MASAKLSYAREQGLGEGTKNNNRKTDKTMKKLVMTLIGLLSLMASMQAQTDWKSQLNYLYGTWTVQYIQDRNDNVTLS